MLPLPGLASSFTPPSHCGFENFIQGIKPALRSIGPYRFQIREESWITKTVIRFSCFENTSIPLLLTTLYWLKIYKFFSYNFPNASMWFIWAHLYCKDRSISFSSSDNNYTTIYQNTRKLIRPRIYISKSYQVKINLPRSFCKV